MAVAFLWAFCENCLSLRVFQRGRIFSHLNNGADAMGTPVFLAAQLLWRPVTKQVLCFAVTSPIPGFRPTGRVNNTRSNSILSN